MRLYLVDRRHTRWTVPLCAALFALCGCQQVVPKPDQGTAEAATSPAATTTADTALPADSPGDGPCPRDISAVLSSGVVVHFAGATDSDPEVCVQRWNGRSYKYYLGFWGNGRFENSTPQLRQAITQVVAGPVGAETTVPLQGRTAGKLWRSATVTHVGNSELQVGHHKRPTLKLRVIRQDALGRNDVASERLYWLDRATGVPLKKQTVTRMADGSVSHITTWEVRAMRSDHTEAASQCVLTRGWPSPYR